MLPIRRGHNFGTYFVTANCASKRSLFQVEASAALLFSVVQGYRDHYKLHAFVIMPDHLHLLLTPADTWNDQCTSKVDFLIDTTRSLGGLKDVWQSGYADHRCRDREDYLKHKQYIEQNPVVAGFCEVAEEYPWSSASRRLRDGDSLRG